MKPTLTFLYKLALSIILTSPISHAMEGPLNKSTTSPTESMTPIIYKDIERVDDSLYIRHKENGLHFAMERYGESNSDFWNKFQSKEMKLAGKWFQGGASQYDNQPSKSKICSNLVPGMIGFKYAIFSHLLFQKKTPFELWILFASSTPISKDKNHPSPDEIEIYCTVSTSLDAPFVTHMGISRCAQFLENNKNVIHHNIAMELHSFGAKIMRMRYPDKLYMLTTAMPIMETIFKNSLGSENIYVGFDEYWPDYIHKLQQESENKDNISQEDFERLNRTLLFFQNKVSSCGNSPILKIDTRGSAASCSFQLKDLSGTIILDLNKQQMRDQYGWYFERETTFSQHNNIAAIPLDILASKYL